MKNPLNKRLPRELISDFGKYIVIFILLLCSIGFVSGYLVADGSMIKAYNDSFEKYNVEDGHFRVVNKINDAQMNAITDFGIKVYNNFYVEKDLDNDSTLRIFANREEVNKICVMKGRLAEKTGEIAIDRMYADNNDLTVGDTITSGQRSWKIVGLVAFSDYSALFQNNGDSMFDSIKFGIGAVCQEEFDTFAEKGMNYCYSWQYDGTSAHDMEDSEEKEKAEDLMDDLTTKIVLDDYIPQYLNQAIIFTGTDMGSDRAMCTVLLYMVIAIIAFVFALTTANTIVQEANVIGTLRASGYSRGELLRHYMIMPMIVILVAALLGNIAGYTFMKNVCASMYYGSYSLPTYVTIWSGDAFVLTTVVPIVMMFFISWFMLSSKLRLSPLKFLRRDLSKNRQRRALRLPKIFPFFFRYHLRVITQNMSNYILMFVGILLANLMLLFGLVFPAMLDYYEDQMTSTMFANYQYLLQLPVSEVNSKSKLEEFINMMVFSASVETDNDDAEKFSVDSLTTYKDGQMIEDVMIYGIDEDSKYVDLDVSDHQIYATEGLMSKFSLKIGDTLKLKDKYDDDYYDFKIDGTSDYVGSLCIFMSMDDFNTLFDEDDDYFCGYFSDTEITDIDSKYISSVIDYEALTKLSRQLDRSMGDLMYIFDVFSVMIFVVVMYILSKIIIDKNAQAISMSKILGYNNGEIDSLYIWPTTIMVIASVFITLPIISVAIEWAFGYMFRTEMSGWINYYQDPIINVKIVVLGIGVYAIVALLEMRRIKNIPMDMALKNVE